jgi:hypothetical protein
MSYTPKTPAERVTETVNRLAVLDELPDAVAAYRDAEIRHARTYRSSDLLGLYETLDEVLCIIERGTGEDFTEQRTRIADEARAECDYDIREGCYIDRDGGPVRSAVPFGWSHPDAGRGFRVGGGA